MLAGNVLLLSSFLATLDQVQALPWDGPEPTPPSIDFEGWTPKPTEAAILRYNEIYQPLEDGLLNRELGVNTCGYQDKNIQYANTCTPGYVCVSNPVNNVMGCCTEREKYLTNCRLFTSCIASTALPVECADKACQTNPFINHCTASPYDVCKTYYFDFGSVTRSELLCDSTTGRYTFYPTYRGASTFTDFAISNINRVTSNTLAPVTFYVPSMSSTSSASSRSRVSSIPAPIATPATTSAVPAATTVSSSSSSSTNTGAIAGGVVGGVAVLALIVGAIVWFCLRRKKQNSTPAAPEPTDPSAATPSVPPSYNYPNSPPQMAAAHPVSGYYGDNKAYGAPVAGQETGPPTLLTYGGQSVPATSPGTDAPSPGWASASNAPASPTAGGSQALEADSNPVMTGPDGRQIFEIHTEP